MQVGIPVLAVFGDQDRQWEKRLPELKKIDQWQWAQQPLIIPHIPTVPAVAAVHQIRIGLIIRTKDLVNVTLIPSKCTSPHSVKQRCRASCVDRSSETEIDISMLGCYNCGRRAAPSRHSQDKRGLT